MRWKTLLFAAAALLLLIVSLPIIQTAVWDGRFLLTIVFNGEDAINANPDTFLFAACWKEYELEFAMRSGPESEVAFYPADERDGNRFIVEVPCSGRSGLFEDSYVQPKYMVVQYSESDDKTSVLRKKFDIPAGRGNRLVRVSLP